MLYDITQVVPAVTRGAHTHCKMEGWWYFQTINHVLHKSMEEFYVGRFNCTNKQLGGDRT